MIRIAICEKDKKQRSVLLEYISMDIDIEDNYMVVCFNEIIEIKKRIDNKDFNFDLLILAFHSSGADSFALVEYIREQNFRIDFFFIAETTDFIMRGLPYKASAYLVKPFSYSEFAYEMKRYLLEKGYQKKYLQIYIHGREQMISLNTVLYFTSNKRKIEIVFFNGDKEIWFYGKLDDLEGRLDPYGFIRCHQSYLVNSSRIEGMHGRKLITSDGEFPISRKYQEIVKEKWEKIREKVYAQSNIISIKS